MKMMDISVSHLNSRLALQLPSELPLGLVFVVGRVENLLTTNGGNGESGKTAVSVPAFDLVETDYRIRCRLTRRAASAIQLEVGQQVRTGGHLTFDGHDAGYYLLVRDIELVQDGGLIEAVIAPSEVASPDEIKALAEANKQLAEAEKRFGRQALSPELADIKRRAETVKLAPAELPYWVKEIAPPEIQAVLTQSTSPRHDSEANKNKPLNEKLVRVLSDAMEKTQDVELTPDMIAVLSPATAREEPDAYTAVLRPSPYQVPPPLAEPVVPSRTPSPPQPRSDTFVTFLIVVFVVLTILITAAAIIALL